MNRSILLTVVLASLTAMAPAQAGVFTLNDGNSAVSVDSGSQAGMFNWSIDGNDVLAQQWFWYRVGPSGGESAISTLSALGSSQTTATLALSYGSLSGLEVDVNYTLNGGTAGSGLSHVHETILLTNNGGTSIDLHFFQYSDFDLSPSDTVTLTSPNVFTQTSTSPARVSETVVSPTPTAHAASFFPVLLNQFNDGSPTTLSGPDTVGPGDVSWAFQWDTTLAPSGVLQIEKDKNFGFTSSSVPEPGVWSLLAGGMFLLGAVRRAKSH